MPLNLVDHFRLVADKNHILHLTLEFGMFLIRMNLFHYWFNSKA